MTSHEPQSATCFSAFYGAHTLVRTLVRKVKLILCQLVALQPSKKAKKGKGPAFAAVRAAIKDVAIAAAACSESLSQVSRNFCSMQVTVGNIQLNHFCDRLFAAALSVPRSLCLSVESDRSCLCDRAQMCRRGGSP